VAADCKNRRDSGAASISCGPQIAGIAAAERRRTVRGKPRREGAGARKPFNDEKEQKEYKIYHWQGIAARFFLPGRGDGNGVGILCAAQRRSS
jgi:hypothetical protein